MSGAPRGQPRRAGRFSTRDRPRFLEGAANGIGPKTNQGRYGAAPDSLLSTGLLSRPLIDEPSDRRVLYIVFVDDGEAGLDATGKAGHAGGVSYGELHRQIAHIEGLLRQY